MDKIEARIRRGYLQLWKEIQKTRETSAEHDRQRARNELAILQTTHQLILTEVQKLEARIKQLETRSGGVHLPKRRATDGR
jgi:hypothetical protein